VRLKFELIRGEGAKTHWRCVFYKKEHTLGLRVMAHFLGKASGGKGHKEIGLFVGGRHFQAGGVVGPFSRFCVSVRGDVFSFRRPGFLSKTLVYMKSFNVQRGGVRSQRSHDHVHVFPDPARAALVSEIRCPTVTIAQGPLLRCVFITAVPITNLFAGGRGGVDAIFTRTFFRFVF
jgi:hypothetical protein